MLVQEIRNLLAVIWALQQCAEGRLVQTCYPLCVSPQHPRRVNFADDPSTRQFPSTGVSDRDGDAFLASEKHRSGMQDFRSSMGQFQRIIKREFFDWILITHIARIVQKNTVYVRPNLYLFRIQSGSYQDCGQIRTIASERRGHTIRARGDETTEHRNNPTPNRAHGLANV